MAAHFLEGEDAVLALTDAADLFGVDHHRLSRRIDTSRVGYAGSCCRLWSISKE